MAVGVILGVGDGEAVRVGVGVTLGETSGAATVGTVVVGAPGAGEAKATGVAAAGAGVEAGWNAGSVATWFNGFDTIWRIMMAIASFIAPTLMASFGAGAVSPIWV